ncbi:MAG: EAL domain-containing protein, partial [Gammaproteobacteria bacterium]|nr:EAL domain-containing protein [Gammaproteobacteria bacterium]
GDWFESRAQAITWTNGRKVRLTIATIINDRKKAEERIKEERAFLQSIINGVADPILVIGKNHQVQLMNKSAKVLSPQQDISAQYQTCHHITHHIDHACDDKNHQCPLKIVQKTGKPTTVLHKHIVNDGSIRSFEIIASPLFNQNNEIDSIVQVSRDITEHLDIQNELQEKKNHLDHLAHYDNLTKLPNRLLLSDRLSQTIKQAHRDMQKVAVLFIDLDHFKEINDSLGHNVGDIILKKTAARLKLCVRETDTVARLGGDEFTIILTNINDNNIIIDIANKIIHSLQNSFFVNEHELYVTSSIGISIYPSDAGSVENLLRNADAAMYKAKDKGRNTYQFYTEDMTQKAFEHILMESNLRHALENNELILYYQPQVNGHTHQIIGMEALVRWQHPQLGLISPDRFIPLAEKTGLIIPLGERVFDLATKQMTLWRQTQKINARVAINLSAKQLQQKNIVEILLNKLKENDCKPNWIEFEITENYIMENPEQAISILQKLQDTGIEISIDDFGTGYSSLSYLKRLPINKLKIDKSFVRDIVKDEDDRIIITSTISLAKNMKLNVIAEGVETIEQKEFILEKGCEMIQGYYYSKPVPEQKMTQLLNFTDWK